MICKLVLTSMKSNNQSMSNMIISIQYFSTARQANWRAVSKTIISIFTCNTFRNSDNNSVSEQNYSNSLLSTSVTDECITNKVSPVGHLNSCLSRWVETGVDNYTCDIISHGYEIPFKTIPQCVELKNNRSS